MIIFIIFSLIGTLTIFVTELADDTYFFDEYVQRTLQQEQLFFISDIGIEAVKNILSQDKNGYDGYDEMWAKPIPIEIEEGSLSILIIDQERYLNPNILINDNEEELYFNTLRRLFFLANIDDYILYNIRDWIDKDTTSSGGEEDYIDYPAKNDVIDTIDELLLIKGVTKEFFYGDEKNGIIGLKYILSPYSNGKVNVNTAPSIVLMALDERIDASLAQDIIAYRKEHPFKTINDLNLAGVSGDIIYNIKDKKRLVDVKSQNFLVKININLGDREYKLTALLEKRAGKITEKWRVFY